MPNKKTKQPISILAIIHDPDQNILLLNRCDVPDFWQSVTGSKEADENITRTAAREILEETGIHCEDFVLHNWQQSHDYVIYEQWRHRYPPGTIHNTEHVFSLCIPKKTPITLQPREHSEYLWLPLQEAAQKVFSPSNKETILMLPTKALFHV